MLGRFTKINAEAFQPFSLVDSGSQRDLPKKFDLPCKDFWYTLWIILNFYFTEVICVYQMELTLVHVNA